MDGLGNYFIAVAAVAVVALFKILEKGRREKGEGGGERREERGERRGELREGREDRRQER